MSRYDFPRSDVPVCGKGFGEKVISGERCLLPLLLFGKGVPALCPQGDFGSVAGNHATAQIGLGDVADNPNAGYGGDGVVLFEGHGEEQFVVFASVKGGGDEVHVEFLGHGGCLVVDGYALFVDAAPGMALRTDVQQFGGEAVGDVHHGGGHDSGLVEFGHDVFAGLGFQLSFEQVFVSFEGGFEFGFAGKGQVLHAGTLHRLSSLDTGTGLDRLWHGNIMALYRSRVHRDSNGILLGIILLGGRYRALRKKEKLQTPALKIKINEKQQTCVIERVVHKTKRQNLQILTMFLEADNHFLTREAIKQRFWQSNADTESADKNLNTHINEIRQILHQHEGYDLITHKGKGYTLVMPE